MSVKLFFLFFVLEPIEPIDMEYLFRPDEPSTPQPPKSACAASCVNLHFDDDLFNPALARQNAERLNRISKAIIDSKNFDQERLRKKNTEYLDMKRQLNVAK